MKTTVNTIEELREILTKKFAKVSGERGEELRRIHFAEIDNEQALIDAYNKIRTIKKDDLSDLLGEHYNSNAKTDLYTIMARIALFNKDCSDIFGQTIRCKTFHTRTENLEYFSMMYGEQYAKEKLERKGSRVKGENNPGYQHGGRLSPFSKKFVNYQGKDEAEVEREISTRYETIKQLKKENPHLESTKIEYYLNKGLTEDEAREALSDRQSTFSLEKCIEQNGEEEGYRIWKERQEKWQNTLKKLPKEERKRMIRAKVRGSWNQLFKINNDRQAYVYLMKSKTDDDLYKFGITTNVEARRVTVSNDLKDKFAVVTYTPVECHTDAIDIEDRLCEIFDDRSLFSLDENSSVKLETFKDNRADDLVLQEWKEAFDR